jgi:leader peptidase (prepilin peptidase) / N-methyltransferase
MIRILGTVFAALLGLAFGSFLNVCLSRWPEGESIVTPRSHCRHCGRVLAWWENVPLVSWIALRGRCRGCGAWISVRYPLVEAVVAALWALVVWVSIPELSAASPAISPSLFVVETLSKLPLCWLLVALLVLDAEHLWLPDRLTLPGMALGFLVFLVQMRLRSNRVLDFYGARSIEWRFLRHVAFDRVLGILLAAGIIVLIRWIYWVIRRREGLGLGDAKLMAMLAAWLGLPGALLSLFLGVVLGALFAVRAMLGRSKREAGSWATMQLPLGAFLCIGGIVSALWGQPIIAAYVRWAGF